MVYGTSLTLPAQLAASSERPVDQILQDLATAAPLPTRHGQREAPTEPPAALATASHGQRVGAARRAMRAAMSCSATTALVAGPSA